MSEPDSAARSKIVLGFFSASTLFCGGRPVAGDPALKAELKAERRHPAFFGTVSRKTGRSRVPAVLAGAWGHKAVGRRLVQPAEIF